MTLYVRNYDTFLNIKNGRKKIEIRLAYGYILSVKPGDTITLQCKKSKIPITISQITYHEFFNTLTLTDVFPDLNNLDEAMTRFQSYYSRDKLEKFPIIALHLNPL